MRRKGKKKNIREGETTKVIETTKERVRNLIILLKKMVLIVIVMKMMKLFMFQ